MPNTQQRPWPVPQAPWVIRMEWYHLMFMHWPVPPELLRPYIPRRFEIDTFDGKAWIGIVPFGMRGVAPRGVPNVPKISKFPELNVRTYVLIDGKPGVWFFSLDAAQPLVVELSRTFFHLNYCHANMRLRNQGGWVYYVSERKHAGKPNARFQARYRPVGPVFYSEPGSLEYWLTERYCMYSADQHNRLWCTEIDHAPWQLQTAEAEVLHNSMTEQLRFQLPNVPPLLHMAQPLNVVAWLPERLAAEAADR